MLLMKLKTVMSNNILATMFQIYSMIIKTLIRIYPEYSSNVLPENKSPFDLREFFNWVQVFLRVPSFYTNLLGTNMHAF